MLGIRILLLGGGEEGLRMSVERHPGFRIVAEARETAEGLVLADLHHPDILLIDLGKLAPAGIEAIMSFKQHFPKVKIIAVSGEDDENEALATLANGGEGYVNNLSLGPNIIDVVYTVLRGQVVLPRAIAKQLAYRALSMPRVHVNADRLSAREKEIVKLLGRGLTSRAIAEELSLSVKTVQNHRVRILRKLQAHNSVEAVAHAIPQVFLYDVGLPTAEPLTGEPPAA